MLSVWSARHAHATHPPPHWRDERLFKLAIQTATDHAARGGLRDRCGTLADELASRIEQIPGERPGDFSGMYLLDAALASLTVAWSDCEDLARDGLEDLDLDRWDAGIYASWVCARKATWESPTPDDDRRRLDFWMAYLQAATEVHLLPASGG